MSKIKNFFCGTVRFYVSGLPVQCINKLRQYKISNVENHNGHVSFSVPLLHANAVKKLVSNFDWKVQENKNFIRGVNFLLNRMILSVSVLLAFIAFFVFDMGIYNIRVDSADAVLTAEVSNYLGEMGVKKFLFKQKIPELNLASNIVDKFPNVAHANVRVSGNTLIVSLLAASSVESKQKVDIYSKYDAVVKNVVIFSGTAVVEVGDVVRKGDLLVLNAYEGSVVIIGEVGFHHGNKIVRLDILIT